MDLPLPIPSGAPPASTSTPPPLGGDWQSVAYAQINKPYIWGSAGGRSDFSAGAAGFDCSGYVSYVMKNGLGIDLPAFTGSAYQKTSAVSAAEARPGDVVFYNMDSSDPHQQHIAIYIGDGKIIQAGGVANTVNVASVNAVGTPEFRRPTGAGAGPSQQLVGGAGAFAAHNLGVTSEGLRQYGPDAPGETLTEAQRQTIQRLSAQGGQYNASGAYGPDAQDSSPLPDTLTEAQRQTIARLQAQQNEQPIAPPAGAPNPSQALPTGPNGIPDVNAMAQRANQQMQDPAVQARIDADAEQARANTHAFVEEHNPIRDVPVLGGLATGAAEGLVDPLTYIAGPAEGVALGEVAKPVLKAAGSALGHLLPEEVAYASTRASEPAAPAIQKILAGQTPPVVENPSTVAQKLNDVQVKLSQWFTDRAAPLSNWEQQASKVLGRPLSFDEQASMWQRLSADPAAEVMVQEHLRPAVQAVGPDYDYLRAYVTAKSNVNVAETLANRVSATERATNPTFKPAEFTAPASGVAPVESVGAPAPKQADTIIARARMALEDAHAQHPNDPQHPAVRQAQEDFTQAVAESNALRAGGGPPAPIPGEPMPEAAPVRTNAPMPGDIRRAVKAQVAANKIRTERQFSGGVTRGESMDAIRAIEAEVGPERFARIQQAADHIQSLNDTIRQRLVESGVWAKEDADFLAREYPDWVKTRILDYMQDPAGQRLGAKLNGPQDQGLRRYTLEGTDRLREDPVASMVAWTHQAEGLARKNEAFLAFKRLNDALPEGNQVLRKVTEDYKPTNAEEPIFGWVNGVKERYVAPKAMAQVINNASVTATPEWTQAWGKVIRALATTRNPAFLVGNAALDIPEAVLRESARLGGPQATPRVLLELIKGYGEAFRGLTTGTYEGDVARMLKAGAGQSGYFTGGEGVARQRVADLQRGNVFGIQSKKDLLDWLALKPVERIGERVELGPRVAAFRLAEQQRGMRPERAAIDARSVTLDFAQGGTVTKFVNQLVPFFNVQFQGPAQVARTMRDHPLGFAYTAAGLIGAPTLTAEAWNQGAILDALGRHDDAQQMRQDYADVSSRYKDQGLVFMLGTASTDKDGTRKPDYLFVNLRNWAPFANITRAGAARALGDGSQGWQEFASSLTQGLVPTQASNPMDMALGFSRYVPGLGTVAQITANKDYFRNRDIATHRNDAQASNLGRAVAGGVNAGAEALGQYANVRPSQVDFAVRDLGSGIGAAVAGASDIGRDTGRTGVQETPGLGGVVGKFVKNQGGEQLRQARDQILPPSTALLLRNAGVTTSIGPVSDAIEGIPLTQGEEASYQRLANQYVDQDVRQLVGGGPQFGVLPQDRKDALVRTIAENARARAAREVLATMPNASQRLADELRKKREGATAP
jgi:hypothetical protein